ncbi:MAG: hypothetical protein WCB15_12150 [Desulfobacterales bacterium]
MLKKIFVLLFIVGMVTQVKLSWVDTYNFRHTSWGMTPEEVIASETMAPIEKDEKMIKYNTQILNKNVELLYLFAQNKLIGASYKLDENYLNSERFIKAYTRFKGELIKKYGQPNKEITQWKNDAFKSDRSKWGIALSLGYLEYFTFWEIPGTTVSCGLKEKNYYVLCSIEYWSMEFSNLLDKNKNGDKPNPF